MRTTTLTAFPIPGEQKSRAPLSCRTRKMNSRKLLLALLLVVPILAVQSLAAQSPAATPASAQPAAPKHHAARSHKHSSSAHSKAAKADKNKASKTLTAQALSPKPELPKWPAKEDPTPASITWDSHGLRIEASNSSLQQILKDVATATGASIEGADDDQRVFGTFGPGPAREVLSLLLHGTGYNVLMVGDQGQGTPREVILSSRNSVTAQSAAHPNPAADSDDDDDEDNRPVQPVVTDRYGQGLGPESEQNSRQGAGRPHPPQDGNPPQN